MRITMDANFQNCTPLQEQESSQDLTSYNTDVCEWQRWLEQIQTGVMGAIAHRRRAVMGIFSPLFEFIGLLYLLNASLDSPVFSVVKSRWLCYFQESRSTCQKFYFL